MKRLIIHCSDTPNGRVTTMREIDRWHAARSDIRQRDESSIERYASKYPYCGYHGGILLDGRLEQTRSEYEVGSHCAGYNKESLGYVLIGRDAFTHEQWETLAWLIRDCRNRWGSDLIIQGHRDLNPNKTCPGFDVATWLEMGMAAPPGHLFSPLGG